jgi:hypothetical protein
MLCQLRSLFSMATFTVDISPLGRLSYIRYIIVGCKIRHQGSKRSPLELLFIGAFINK